MFGAVSVNNKDTECTCDFRFTMECYYLNWTFLNWISSLYSFASIANQKPVILPKWIQLCINQLHNPFTTFSDEKQQKMRQNKQIFRPNKAKYIVFTAHIGRARERHRGYGSNNLWIDQSGSFFNPVWPEPLNDGSGYEIVFN
jgi:hypothetical protein